MMLRLGSPTLRVWLRETSHCSLSIYYGGPHIRHNLYRSALEKRLSQPYLGHTNLIFWFTSRFHRKTGSVGRNIFIYVTMNVIITLNTTHGHYVSISLPLAWYLHSFTAELFSYLSQEWPKSLRSLGKNYHRRNQGCLSSFNFPPMHNSVEIMRQTYCITCLSSHVINCMVMSSTFINPSFCIFCMFEYHGIRNSLASLTRPANLILQGDCVILVLNLHVHLKWNELTSPPHQCCFSSVFRLVV